MQLSEEDPPWLGEPRHLGRREREPLRDGGTERGGAHRLLGGAGEYQSQSPGMPDGASGNSFWIWLKVVPAEPAKRNAARAVEVATTAASWEEPVRMSATEE